MDIDDIVELPSWVFEFLYEAATELYGKVASTTSNLRINSARENYVLEKYPQVRAVLETLDRDKKL